MCITATAPRRWSSRVRRSASSRCTNIRGIREPGRSTSAAAGMCSTCRGRVACRAPSMCATSSPAWMLRSRGGARTFSSSPRASTRSRAIHSASSPWSPTTSSNGRTRCASGWERGPSSVCWRAATDSTCSRPVSSHSFARYLEDVTAPPPTVPAQQPQASKNWPASLYRRSDGVLEQDISPARIRETLQAGEGELWVDIDSTNMHQLALLEKVFAFHPLSIEDTLSPGTRVKFEEYERYVFVVMAVIRFDEGTPEPYDLATSNLYFFLGKNFLVTVHALPQQSCELVRERLIRNPELLARGVEMAMHNIIDQSVDAYFPMVEELNTMVDGLEERLFERFNPGLIHEIFKAKRAAFSLRRHVGPLREVLNILTNRPCGFIRPETQLYYRDVYDHTIRIADSMDTVRDLLAGVLETYLSQTSNRLNTVMKQLSLVATIALPLIVIAGIFGMNFSQMPSTHNPYGFYGALVVMAVTSGVIVWWLKKNRWL